MCQVRQDTSHGCEQTGQDELEKSTGEEGRRSVPAFPGSPANDCNSLPAAQVSAGFAEQGPQSLSRRVAFGSSPPSGTDSQFSLSSVRAHCAVGVGDVAGTTIIDEVSPRSPGIFGGNLVPLHHRLLRSLLDIGLALVRAHRTVAAHGIARAAVIDHRPDSNSRVPSRNLVPLVLRLLIHRLLVLLVLRLETLLVLRLETLLVSTFVELSLVARHKTRLVELGLIALHQPLLVPLVVLLIHLDPVVDRPAKIVDHSAQCPSLALVVPVRRILEMIRSAAAEIEATAAGMDAAAAGMDAAATGMDATATGMDAAATGMDAAAAGMDAAATGMDAAATEIEAAAAGMDAAATKWDGYHHRHWDGYHRRQWDGYHHRHWDGYPLWAFAPDWSQATRAPRPKQATRKTSRTSCAPFV